MEAGGEQMIALSKERKRFNYFQTAGKGKGVSTPGSVPERRASLGGVRVQAPPSKRPNAIGRWASQWKASAKRRAGSVFASVRVPHSSAGKIGEKQKNSDFGGVAKSRRTEVRAFFQVWCPSPTALKVVRFLCN
ncbi:Hypothetical protein NTJ_06534 [Nesidiocoris tenuis]|uniref:Uncharacterized protein n=1 Tax=Nesidiocoris tenuis TaxID=355587 RepID=A0ABN7ANC3_9HEMI|nr:Hypothetical protein NTJ_06534 [Nesidiocoris tenuis]